MRKHPKVSICSNPLRPVLSLQTHIHPFRKQPLIRSTGNAPPVVQLEEEDESMMDVDDESRPGTPQEDADEANDGGTPEQDSDLPDEGDIEAPTPQPAEGVPKKRRPGRPPKIRPADWGAPDQGGDEGSESGTPAKRRRGRPAGAGGGWRGGFRGGRGRGGGRGPSHTTRAPTDKDGNTLEVLNDEIALPEDPEGETKVDKNGVLLGGRQYRVRTFTIQGRGDRLYMLSTEPARCTGFRDSYLFFTKHLYLYKIITGDEEKRDLIERQIIPHSYKGRAIGVVTARSVFREFGSKIVIGGRKVTDDYQTAAARERGDVEGELTDPTDRLPSVGEGYNRNQYVAWHGASSVYHNNAPNIPLAPGRPVMTTKRKTPITGVNWMVEHAKEASRFNSDLRRIRCGINDTGVYDPHTNMLCWPANTQPTHAKWEQVVSTPSVTPMEDDQTAFNSALAEHDLTNGSSSLQLAVSSRFAALPVVIPRNYLVVDTHSQASMTAHACNPPLSGFPDSLPDVTTEDLMELPLECREALLQARKEQDEWRRQWTDEGRSGLRGQLRIGIGGV